MDDNSVEYTEFEWPFPYSAVIAGGSGCGKTVYLAQIIRNHNKMCQQSLAGVLYFYAIHQPVYEEMEQEFGELITFIQGSPDPYFATHDPKELANHLVIFDDLQKELSKSDLLELIYSRMSHHNRFAVITVLQTFFGQEKSIRAALKNAHYFIFFQCNRMAATLFHLQRQIVPQANSNFLTDAYAQCQKIPYSPMVLDMRPQANQLELCRQEIFPTTGFHYVFLPSHLGRVKPTVQNNL